MTKDHFALQSALDFEQARRRAFFRRVLSLLLGRDKDNRLLSYEAVTQKLRCHDESYGGMREVPVEAIVGSVGRYKDFDGEFLPVRKSSRERWRRIAEAYYRDVVLPPVQLYQVGDVYFVKDGNHRVSVAREKGIAYVDAEVVEVRCRVPLTGEIRAEDLEELGGQAQFLEWSVLDRLRPGADIRFTVPGGYHQVEEHINVHRHMLGIERGTDVSIEEAVTSWFDTVYMPVVRLVRKEGILERFPQRTEADVYLWIMDHLYDLRVEYGDEVELEEAVADFQQHTARSSVLQAVSRRIAGRTSRRRTRPQGGKTP